MTSGLNILHVIGSAESGGGERYLYDLIKYSSKEFKHKVVLPYRGPFEELLKKAGYDYLIVDLQKKFSFQSLYRIKKVIKKNKIKILHSHGYRANFYARLSCIFTKTINISTVHVSLYDYIDTSKLRRIVYIFLEKILSYKTSKFICISKAMKSDMIKLGIKKNKLVLISNGVDLERFKRHNSDQKKRDLGISNLGPVIGTVGRMVTEKGQVYLIEALKKIKNNFQDIKCLFVGEGPMLKELRQKAYALGINDCCVFTGAVTDIESIYPILDVFVLPSLREPFGLALLEAMACGIPIIATNTGGPNDIISDGVNGFLIPAMDSDAISFKLKFLLQNNSICKSIGINGRKAAIKNFDVKNTVKRIEKVYLEII